MRPSPFCRRFPLFSFLHSLCDEELTPPYLDRILSRSQSSPLHCRFSSPLPPTPHPAKAFGAVITHFLKPRGLVLSAVTSFLVFRPFESGGVRSTCRSSDSAHFVRDRVTFHSPFLQEPGIYLLVPPLFPLSPYVLPPSLLPGNSKLLFFLDSLLRGKSASSRLS